MQHGQKEADLQCAALSAQLGHSTLEPQGKDKNGAVCAQFTMGKKSF